MNPAPPVTRYFVMRFILRTLARSVERDPLIRPSGAIACQCQWALSCVKELAGLDLDIAGVKTCRFGLRLVRISPCWVSATAQVRVVAASSYRPPPVRKGSLPDAHPVGVVVNRPSVWSDR